MTKRLRSFAFPALLMLTAAASQAQPPAPPAGGPKQSFRWKFPAPGGSFTLETTTDLKQTVKVTKQEETKLVQRCTLTCSYTVEQAQADGESTTLLQKIEAVRVQAPVGSPPGKIYQQLEGATLKLTLNKSCQLIRLEGYEDLLKKVAGDDPNVRRVIQAIVSEESIRRSIEESFAFLPTDEVAPGQSWERKFTGSLGPLGTLSIVNVYTYERPETEGGQILQRISVRPQIVYNLPKAESAGLPFQIPSGQVRVVQAGGLLWWNAAEGMLARSAMTLHLVGKLAVKARDQDAVLDLDSEQTVEIKLVKPTNQ